MTPETIKSIQNHFTEREIAIIAESLNAYDRYVGGTKQTRYEANKLYQLFNAAKK